MPSGTMGTGRQIIVRRVAWKKVAVQVAAAVAVLLAQPVAAPAAVAPRIGQGVGPLVFHDLRGRRYRSVTSDESRVTRNGKHRRDRSSSLVTRHSSLVSVFVFLSTQCPVSKRYGTRLVELARTYGSRGVRWFVVNASRDESAAEVARDAAERGFRFPVVKDTACRLADRLGARMTPEAVVLDHRGIVRYRGRIDDHIDTTQVRSRDLRRALDALLAGRPVPRPETAAFGCAIPRPAPRVAGGPVTFARDVAPILQRRCQSCHRPGQVGPFPLLTYAQAARWAGAIQRVTATRRMPPWKAVRGFGDLNDDQSLTDPEIRTIARWVEGGAPEGDPHLTPPLRTFPPRQAWILGTPDLVLDAGAPYPVPADGPDVYRDFVLPGDFNEDRWVTAVEFQPDQRAVVHHAILYADPTGRSLAMDQAGPGPGFTISGADAGFHPALWLDGWAVGGTPGFSPPGTAVRIPAHSHLVLQVHYHPDGQPHRDRTRIGLHFARGPIDKRLRVAAVLPRQPQPKSYPTLVIPAGAARHEVTASTTLPADITVLAVGPHMHRLGREMKVTATRPDGGVKPLVWIKDWDFNWQQTYGFSKPLKLPRGSRLNLLAYFDNSAKNPHNPNRPPKQVTWGPQTTDEMCIAFIAYTLDSEHLTRSAAAGSPLDEMETR